jgi:hypothetical protein
MKHAKAVVAYEDFQEVPHAPRHSVECGHEHDIEFSPSGIGHQSIEAGALGLWSASQSPRKIVRGRNRLDQLTIARCSLSSSGVRDEIRKVVTPRYRCHNEL